LAAFSLLNAGACSGLGAGCSGCFSSVTFGNVSARGIFLAMMKIGFSALAILAQ
jgi:hypothetical protein